MNGGDLVVEGLEVEVGAFRLRVPELVCSGGGYHILLGPTGSGKSTLIKCVLGLLPPRRGSIRIGATEIVGTPPEKRGMGYLPQHQSLFPHLDVEENIRFSLRAARAPADRADDAVERLCSLLRLQELRGRAVRGLSGGEKQKVALARALAGGPRFLILDEPFGSIDPGQRRRLWFEVRKALDRLRISTLHITHDLEEAYTLGDRITVMIAGAPVQSSSREDLFRRPAAPAVAEFLNYRNIFTGKAEPLPGGDSSIDCGPFRIRVGNPPPPGGRATVCLRPQDIKIIRDDAPVRRELAENLISGTIAAVFPLPEQCVLHFRADGSRSEFDLELKFPDFIRQRLNLREGAAVRVAPWKPGIIVWPAAP